MTRIEIKDGELGTTRVFSLSMPAGSARALAQNAQAQMKLLGNDALNADGIEVFALTDLGEIGLAGYLREGTDARDADLRRDAERLAALDGWVMLVHSLAFGGQARTLEPDAVLTLIGTYTQTAPDRKPVTLEAEAAKPYSGSPDLTPHALPNRRASGSIVVAALIVLAAMILWWALT